MTNAKWYNYSDEWHAAAFELYFRQNMSINEVHAELIKTYPEIPFETLRKLWRTGLWADRRLYSKSVELTPQGLEPLWRKKNTTVKLAIRDMIQNGMRLKTAAALVGWQASDIKQWIKDDPKFARRIQQAVAIFEATTLDKIKAVPTKDGKTLQYLLETHEDLKEIYSKQDKGGGMQIIVNMDRPVLGGGDMPQVTVHRGETYDHNTLIEDAEFVDVKRLEPEKKAEHVMAGQRVHKHNDAVLKRRQERLDYWRLQKEQQDKKSNSAVIQATEV